jgi:hypothetical protein
VELLLLGIGDGFLHWPIMPLSAPLKGDPMSRIFAVVALFLLCVSNSVSQTPSSNPRLMSDADYKTFLSQVETALPMWESDLKNIDLEKVPQLPYPVGKSIADSKTVGLMEIDNIRTLIHSQRVKRTVYGELALKGCLDSLYDMAEEIVWSEAIEGVTLTSLEKYGPELSTLNMRLATDAMARVQLLEKGACPR